MGSALIIGATGQDGSYLAEHLLAKGHTVYGTVRGLDQPRLDWLRRIAPGLRLISADLIDDSSLRAAVEEAQPDEVYNLGAISSPTQAWAQPKLAAQVTGLGVLRLLGAVKAVMPKAHVVQAGSLATHGPYGAAKLFAQAICADFRAQGLHVAVAVFGGHHSPRKGRTYFSRKISIAAAETRLGLRDIVPVGWLEGLRDWGWAPDFVTALPILAHLQADDYTLSTGEPHAPREWVRLVYAHLGLDWKDHISVDESLGNRIERNQTAPSDPRLLAVWQPRLEFSGLAEWMVRADLAELERPDDRPTLGFDRYPHDGWPGRSAGEPNNPQRPRSEVAPDPTCRPRGSWSSDDSGC